MAMGYTIKLLGALLALGLGLPARAAQPAFGYIGQKYSTDGTVNTNQPPNPEPPDSQPPTITITSPVSGPTYSTAVGILDVSGSGSDDRGVTLVTWSNDRGGSGTATGTTSWSVSGIVLLAGANVITITGRDLAGNTGSDVVTVTYTPPPPAVGFYVSPNGSSISTDGDFNHPWNFPYALSGAGGRIQSGNIVWMRGGIYSGNFVWTVPGATFRAYTNETPVVAGAALIVPAITGANVTPVLTINVGSGNIAILWGVEVKDEIDMTSLGTGSAGVAPAGISVQSGNISIRNCVIRNCGQGLGLFDQRVSPFELYGTLIYYSGNNAKDHHLYVQTKGPSTFKFNELLTFGCIQEYSIAFTGDAGITAHDIEMTGGVWWNNNDLHLAIGYSDGVNVNCTYNFCHSYWLPSLTPNRGCYFANTGGPGSRQSQRVSNCYLVGGNAVADFRGFTSSVVTNNIFVAQPGNVVVASAGGASFGAVNYNRNWYWGTESTLFSGTGAGDFTAWKSQTGWDANSTFTTGVPTTNHVVVRTNFYEPGRGHVIIYNWANANNVNANLSTLGLANGQPFRIFYAMNWKGNPVINTTYNSGAPTVSIPMTNLVAEVPYRSYMPAVCKTSTAPLFGAFIVVPTY